MLSRIARLNLLLWSSTHLSHLFYPFHPLMGAEVVFLAIANSAVMSIGAHTPFQANVFIFFGQTPRRGLSDSLSSSTLSFLRTLHTVFHGGCTNLFPINGECQFLLFLAFLIISFLTGVVGYLIMVLICISPMINDIEPLHGPVGHLYVFFEEILFRSSAYFLSSLNCGNSTVGLGKLLKLFQLVTGELRFKPRLLDSAVCTSVLCILLSPG